MPEPSDQIRRDTGPGMSQENVAVVHQLAAALGRRDLDLFLEVTDPAVEWHTYVSVISQGGAYRGHDGIRQYMSDMDETFESLETTLDRTLDVGDLVLAVGRIHYRGKASGVEMDAPVGWVFRFRQGKIIYLRTFRDPEQVLGAVGLTDSEGRSIPTSP
jgi:ketosteroid isomerase-like protein